MSIRPKIKVAASLPASTLEVVLPAYNLFLSQAGHELIRSRTLRLFMPI
jgi:hypothetical protein